MSTSLTTHRRCFTLLELLVVMMIFSILTSTVLFTMSSAEIQARASKTKEIINRLNALVMAKWNSYQTRRVPINTFGMAPGAAASARLDALRELMRMELPDRFTDITTDPKVLPARPAISEAYKNFLASKGKSETFQGAECLYMFITFGTEEGASREFFKESEIGDTDGDGLPEFLDAWDKPISFLRWAPGFKSELQDQVTPDPFDPRKVKTGTYKLVPLIFSAGPDGEYELGTNSNTTNDPFSDKTAGAYFDANGNGKDDSIDNMHNHFNVID